MENDNNNFNQNRPEAQIPEINSIPPISGQGFNTDQQQQQYHHHHHQQQQQQQQQQQYQQPNINQQNNNNNNNQQNQNYNFQDPNPGVFLQNIPNATGVLTLGILSILSLCCCGPFLGPILAIIALFLIPKAKREYNANPKLYKSGSYSSLKAGQICAIISLALGVLMTIYVIVSYSMDSANMNNLNQVFNNAWNEMGY